MTQYIPPLADLQFVLYELADLNQVLGVAGYVEISPELLLAVLEEAGKFASRVMSPINRIGDIEGARLEDGNTTMPSGWKAAYASFVDAGWNARAASRELGGQNLPRVIAAAVEEMWNGASVAFALLPILSRGATNVLQRAGSDQLKALFLPKLVTSEWTGTMVLPELQAGSDLSAVRTRALPKGDGTYRLHGTKIFITYGDHDLAPNIVHLVLARVEGARSDTKGISLFAVAKIMVNGDGSLGARNVIRCVSLERKLGIHATPTCVLAFGDTAGAVSYLVGEENRGLESMFIMMDAARFAVGLDGIGLGERAYQPVRNYARERLQGIETGAESNTKVPIIRHPDVRRMLMSMKCLVESMRALALVVATSMDKAAAHSNREERRANQGFVDLMMPVVKAWFTETGLHIASMGIQFHGGTGFIEETGAAQHLRDARITTIYEGTTGIQAIDLVGRKVARDGGEAIRALIAQIEEVQLQLMRHADSHLSAIGGQLAGSTRALSAAVDFVIQNQAERPKLTFAGSVPFLDLLGVVACGWQMGRAALAANRLIKTGNGKNNEFLEAKILAARFYADHMLSRSTGLSHVITQGASASLQISDAML